MRWQASLRRFDLEHIFRLMKQTLGWTRPKLRTLEAGDGWTWLVVAAHTQLRLTREAAADLRRPWERPAEPGRFTPVRVRRGFRNLRPHLHCPARAPKPLVHDQHAAVAAEVVHGVCADFVPDGIGVPGGASQQTPHRPGRA
ncbi:hypothetical protein GCM10010289_83330 [Streptomyces violascens]|uniref:Transposase n=1 Tax=Streptomyces violascens TaxID=67381 RepID=A0ABQ3QSW4_9ACTN|nr:hypothetical protein GCM10010289_83330 [Streptomyces violascens]GHI40361.1 hypothetical protein Sviol_47690 [Streptomyces violascens]